LGELVATDRRAQWMLQSCRSMHEAHASFAELLLKPMHEPSQFCSMMVV
jgi:hypothetical protein